MINHTGTLYCVATPIGNLADFSARAIETLKTVDVIAAEDTRHSQPLLAHYAISTPMFAYHEHNESEQTTSIIKQLLAGKNIALISDAGTPLINDPGYQLIKQARAAQINVVPIPGACAIITALQVSGLPTDRFYFAGFPPTKEIARQNFLTELKPMTCTLIFYEAPHRILDCLQSMSVVFGSDRKAVIGRELTKKFETFYNDSLENIINYFSAHAEQQRGEFVVLIHGAPEINAEIGSEIQAMLKILLQELPLTQAVKLAAQISGIKKNTLYDLALALQKTE
ncbi:MAG: 16S rRNA (cytidine(1402)-2'-O)-methyltransferase [Gammaproteobacteria bacterium]|nr:16S rRNA (cytidine(1402)-2'-O)-methyltransferase [Gammaproteobacteria bacterium]